MRREVEKHEPALSDGVKLIFTDTAARSPRTGESWWGGGVAEAT